MACRLGWIVLVTVGVVLWTAPAPAERVTDFEGPAWPGTSHTFLRLGQAVFPGARPDEDAGGLLVTTREKVLRQPGTKERASLPEATRITELEAFTVRGEGRRYLVTLWNAAASVRVSPRTDCPRGKTFVRPRDYSETYRWDPATRQYRPAGKGFEVLDKFNTESL